MERERQFIKNIEDEKNEEKNKSKKMYVSPSGTIETMGDTVEEAEEYQEKKKEYLG